MNVDLPSDLEALVHRKVASGAYVDKNDVLREALHVLSERDQFQQAETTRLRAALERGLAQAERGQLQDGPGVVLKVLEILKGRGQFGQQDA